MKAGFAVLLFCLGLLLLGTHPEYGTIKGAHAQVGCGIRAQSVFTGCTSQGASCAGFTIDGAATSQPATGSSTSTQNITTTHTNEIIFSIITLNGAATLSNTTDTAGLSWTSPRASIGGSLIYESWALSSGTLSGDTITTHYSSTSTTFIETVVFGVAGAHTASAFDSGGPQTASSSPVSITTASNNDLVLGFSRNSGYVAPTSPWVSVITTGFTLAQHNSLSGVAAGTYSISDPGNTPNGDIADALVCGP